jgi:hypothetical protein
MDLLTKVKRKTLFKKHKAREVQAQIAELRMQSKKLKKKNAADKAEKKKISKQIKELKSLIRRAGEDVSSGSDSD